MFTFGHFSWIRACADVFPVPNKLAWSLREVEGSWKYWIENRFEERFIPQKKVSISNNKQHTIIILIYC